MSVINTPFTASDVDPNAFKNRVPTAHERQFLLLLIHQQQEELEQLMLRREVLGQQMGSTTLVLQECQHTVAMAKRLEVLSHVAWRKIEDMSPSVVSLDADSTLWERPATPLSQAAFDAIVEERKRIVDSHHLGLRMFRDNLERTMRQVFDAHAELEANQSLLSTIKQSLASLDARCSQILYEIHVKRDLIGPRRRLPSDVWVEVFDFVIQEEEALYELTGREGTSPFPTLRLSWVCQLWRRIAQNHPKLWRWIALPRALELSFAQWARLTFYQTNLKAVEPIVYVVPDSRGEASSQLRIIDILRRFTSFKLLELRVSRRNSEAEDILAALDVPISQLRLIGVYKGGSAGTSCPLKHVALKKVQCLSCIHVQPSIRNSTPRDEVMNISTVNFTQSNLDARATILFLETIPSIESVSFTLVPPFMIDGDGFRSPITLAGITTIEVSLALIHLLFPSEVSLPRLTTVLIDESVLGSSIALFNWTTFISHNRRRESLRHLTIAALPFKLDYQEPPHAYSSILNEASKIVHLTLVGEAIEPVLRDLHLVPNLRLERLTLRKVTSPFPRLLELISDLQLKRPKVLPPLNIADSDISTAVIQHLVSLGIRVVST